MMMIAAASSSLSDELPIAMSGTSDMIADPEWLR